MTHTLIPALKKQKQNLWAPGQPSSHSLAHLLQQRVWGSFLSMDAKWQLPHLPTTMPSLPQWTVVPQNISQNNLLAEGLLARHSVLAVRPEVGTALPVHISRALQALLLTTAQSSAASTSSGTRQHFTSPDTGLFQSVQLVTIKYQTQWLKIPNYIFSQFWWLENPRPCVSRLWWASLSGL